MPWKAASHMRLRGMDLQLHVAVFHGRVTAAGGAKHDDKRDDKLAEIQAFQGE